MLFTLVPAAVIAIIAIAAPAVTPHGGGDGRVLRRLDPAPQEREAALRPDRGRHGGGLVLATASSMTGAAAASP